MMTLPLDTQEHSQANPSGAPQARQARTIYDAGYNEIFWKSLLAGFSLGIGRTFASIIFYVVVFGLAATYILPMLDQIMAPINRLIPVLEQSTKQTQGIQDQFGSIFGSTTKQP